MEYWKTEYLKKFFRLESEKNTFIYHIFMPNVFYLLQNDTTGFPMKMAFSQINFYIAENVRFCM